MWNACCLANEKSFVRWLLHTNHEFNTPMKCYNKQEFSSPTELNNTSQNQTKRNFNRISK